MLVVLVSLVAIEDGLESSPRYRRAMFERAMVLSLGSW